MDVEESNQASTIRAIAVELLVLINGIARLRLDNPDPVSLGNVRRYGEGGAKDVFVFPAAAIARARMGTPTIAVNGVVMAPPSWLPDIEQADDAVEAVLTFLSIVPTWHSLYAALDTVLSDPVTGRKGGAMRFAQVTEAQLRAFKQTANAFRAVGVEARHGPKVTPPAAPMSMTDATALVIHIIESWLAERKARLG